MIVEGYLKPLGYRNAGEIYIIAINKSDYSGRGIPLEERRTKRKPRK